MKTFDGFKLKDCIIKEGCLYFDRKSIPIKSLEDKTDSKPFLWLLFIGLFLYLTLSFYPLVNEIVHAVDFTDKIVKLFFACFLYMASLIAGYHMLLTLRYRGIWIANDKKPIYIEKDDPHDVDSILNETKRRLG